MLEEGFGLRIGRNEWHALICIFGSDIARDGAALVKYKTIILEKSVRTLVVVVQRLPSYIKNGDLAKWLLLQVLCRFMVTLPLVELNKLEADVLFVQDGRYTSSAGGRGEAVECQDHGCKLDNVLGRGYSPRLCEGPFYQFQKRDTCIRN